MFLGEHYRTIDNKGRIFIPAKFREDLIKGIVISKGFDEKCLFLFSMEGWKRLEEKMMANKIAERNTQRFSRWFFSSASEESMDQQGRIRIPQSLIEHAELKKDVVLVGVLDRAEIWAKENWNEYYKKADSQFMGDKDSFEQLRF
ncbi:MAG: division/cell wall cluster transcriptional repressor MraZ [Actinomycetota bacterium]|jgi:MraZ protein|nr:division/cell wall cluster transcriptional repressor MraZ [Actinomycetota bacterium]